MNHSSIEPESEAAEMPVASGVSRRRLFEMTGAVMLGSASLLDLPAASAQDLSNGAANFYTDLHP